MKTPCPYCEKPLKIELKRLEDKATVDKLEAIALAAERQPLGESLTDSKCYVWKKCVTPLLSAMRSLKHIGMDYQYLSWCACAAYRVHLDAGIELPPIPRSAGKNYWASMALVEAMEWYAKKAGVYIKEKRGVIPQRGWTVFFDWDGDKWEDHVGIVLSNDQEQYSIKTFEGNRGNQTVVGVRDRQHVSGYADFSKLGAS